MWLTAGYVAMLPGYRHLMFDHRGHGRSSKPREPSQHRLDEYVADVLAVLDAEGLDSVIFVGYSDGGHVGCALAARHPGRVAALVNIGGVGHPDDDPTERSRFAVETRRAGITSIIEGMVADEGQPAWQGFIRNLSGTETELFATRIAPASLLTKVGLCRP